MRPLVAHSHLGLGKLYRGTGKRQEAQGHLTVATTLYREMGMRFWLEKAEAEMRGLVCRGRDASLAGMVHDLRERRQRLPRVARKVGE